MSGSCSDSISTTGGIAAALAILRHGLPAGVELLCVSKYHSEAAIMEAYRTGERMFGESRVQELQRKYEVLPKDIRWHFIGHLQTNKIRSLLPMVSLIHGIDSWRLLCAVNAEAAKLKMFRDGSRRVNLLLEVRVATEDTKYGFTPDQLLEMLHTMPWRSLSHVNICGLMGMATHTGNEERIREEFALLHRLFVQVRDDCFAPSSFDGTLSHTFNTLSMGMTGDWRIAVAEGSTLVRIGSGIFGGRL